MKKPTGYVIYEGESLLDGAPIVVIVTGIKGSANPKTGNMLQTWILRRDVSPREAVETGQDASICGDCVHRGGEGRIRTCYVKVWQAPRSVWECYKRGGYPRATSPTAIEALGRGRAVRIGSYGDPSAAPSRIWEDLTAEAETWTGYTHQWRSMHARLHLRHLLMASVDSPEERIEAALLGWRTFHVLPKKVEPGNGEIRCPASKEAGNKSTCAKCSLCSGASSTARVSVAINLH